MIAGLICIATMKYTAGKAQTMDYEYWGGYGVEAVYNEHWNEYIHRTCTRQSCSGSGKNRSCTTTTYDCSYVKDHPEYWTIEDNNRIEVNIDESQYKELARRWNNNTFRAMHHPCHTICGDAYFTRWDKNWNTYEFVTTVHTYENRVQAQNPNSLYGFPTVTKEQAKNEGLFEYPEIVQNYKVPTFLVEGQKTGNILVAENKINKFAAEYGFTKHIRPWFVIFNHGTVDRCKQQQNYWKGSNKNEFVICMIMNGTEVQDVYPFTWSEADSLRIEARDWFKMNHSNDIPKYAEWFTREASTRFKKKSFKEFSYLAVQLPFKWVAWSWVLTLVVSVGCTAFCVMNEIDDDGNPRYGRTFGQTLRPLNRPRRRL